MTKTVLITGSNGNLGEKLGIHFASLGWHIRRIDSRAGHHPDTCIADMTRWDDSWVSQFAGVDAVVHLAGEPSPMASWERAQTLNIDLTMNVYEAAVRQGAKRLIFASSNWVMAGYRPSGRDLPTDIAPHPINPYGVSKLIGERLGRNYHDRWGLSVICFRIGYCQRGDNLPGPHMAMGRWGQQMWLSNRDLCHGFERAVLADKIGFEVLNLMSDNPGMPWDLDPTRRALGYTPKDSHGAVETEASRHTEAEARRMRETAQWLDHFWLSRDW